jgi:adenylate kinase
MSRRLISWTLLGPPGSGKGTYGSMLAAALQCPLRTTSDVLREWSQEDPSMALQMKTGQLVDDSLVYRLMCNELTRWADSSLVLLDGFPRTMTQLHLMQNYWPAALHLAIRIHVPDAVCVAKIMGRRLCTICHGNFNIAHVDTHGFFMPPTLPNVSSAPCWNRCGGKRDEPNLVIRPDDANISVIQSRLHLYHEQTIPVIEWYRQQDKLISFTPHRGKLDFYRLEAMIRERILAENK